MLAAVDGSTIWVQAGPVLGLVGGSLALTTIGTLLLVRGAANNQQFGPPQVMNQGGRRKMRLVKNSSNFDENAPKTIDAERLEDVITPDPKSSKEESLKDVSDVIKK